MGKTFNVQEQSQTVEFNVVEKDNVKFNVSLKGAKTFTLSIPDFHSTNSLVAKISQYMNLSVANPKTRVKTSQSISVPANVIGVKYIYKKILRETLSTPTQSMFFNKITMFKKITSQEISVPFGIGATIKGKALTKDLTFVIPSLVFSMTLTGKRYNYLSNFDALYLSGMDDEYLQNLDYTLV